MLSAMPERPPSLLSLQAFEAAARLGGFTEAAAELSLSQSTVSYRVRQLEEQLGLPLFRRLTRRIVLTEAGRRFLPTAEAVLSGLREAIAQLRADYRPRLRLRLSTYFASRWLSPRLSRWAAEGGETIILVHGDDSAPVDLEIRWGRGDQKGAGAKLLLATRMVPYAAPAICEKLTAPADLAALTLLSEPEPLDMWPAWFAAAGLPMPTRPSRLVLSDSNVRIQAAVDGLGVVLADQLIAPEVAAGKLIAPFAVAAKGSGYYLLRGKQPSPASDGVAAWLLRTAAADKVEESELPGP